MADGGGHRRRGPGDRGHTDAGGLAALPSATRDLYRSEQLLVVATDAHAVAPALDRVAPSPEADWTITGWHDNVARGAC